MSRWSPNAKLPDGRLVHAMGEPFRVWEHPPGIVWGAVVFPDMKLRPMPADQVLVHLTRVP